MYLLMHCMLTSGKFMEKIGFVIATKFKILEESYY